MKTVVFCALIAGPFILVMAARWYVDQVARRNAAELARYRQFAHDYDCMDGPDPDLVEEGNFSDTGKVS